MSLGFVNDHGDSLFKIALDAASLSVAVASLAQVLPAVAALFSIVWSVIRILETKTVRDRIVEHKARRLIKKMLKDDLSAK